MILESLFSCSCLLLTCGSCIYVLMKHSYNQYHRLLLHYKYACSGIVMIGIRSLIVLFYKLFFKQYPFDPVEIELEEERNKGKLNIANEMLGTLSMASLIYSVFCHHGYYILGTSIVTGLSALDMWELHKSPTQPLEPDSFRIQQIPPRLRIAKPRYIIYFWVYVNGYFGYAVGNYYALLSNYPYLFASWTFNPEGFYQGWTIRRCINDYMMAAYVIYMVEALRQTPML